MGLSLTWQPVHSFTLEQRLRPGEIVPVDIELRPQATRFDAGDTLRLEIRGTWLYSRDPFTGAFPASYAGSPKGRFVVHSGGVHDAYLLLGMRRR
jgi:predicted acyl esterase